MVEALRVVGRGFRVQRRVIAALIGLHFVSRWGRRNLGFAWLFAEPLIFAFPVLTIWTLIRPKYEMGLPMTAFLWSAYMPLLIYRHVTSGAVGVLRNALTMFYHRQVTPMDVFVATVGLEAVGNLASVALSFAVFYVTGLITIPADYSLFLLGFIYTTWWSLAVALLLAPLAGRYEIVPHIWAPMSYLYIFFSGCFWFAAWLPERIRTILLAVDPPLHCYEMIRAGLFGNRLQTYYDVPYLTILLIVLSFIGFWLMRDVRQHLDFE